MNKIILFLSIAIWPLAMLAGDDKCGCSKPRPAKTPQVSRPVSELPKPAPQQRAEADEPDREEREEIVEQVKA